MFARLFLKIVSLVPIFVFANVLEVSLPIQKNKIQVYITELHAPPSDFDWAHLEKLRDIFVRDFNTNGVSKIAFNQGHLEKKLSWPDIRSNFDITVWKKEEIPFLLAVQVIGKRLQITAFDISKGSSKKYPGFVLSGDLDQDRKEVHRLSSAVSKDLFGTKGVSALRLIYAKRIKFGNDWKSEIWMCDSDGANDRRVLSDEGYCVCPAFFPYSKESGREFYYVSYRDGQSKIYRTAIGSHQIDPLIHLRGSQVLPSVNRQGTQVAFITDAAGRPDLFIQDLGLKGQRQGKPRQLFSKPNATQASPTYSPDGKQLAFVSDKEGSPRVYIMDVPHADASPNQETQVITKLNRENTSPAWSPDGRKIAYSAKVDGVRQIWVYDFVTNSERALTRGPENKENPSWAPDSMHLVYNTESNDKSELYQIHLIHAEPILITNGPHQKRFASWVY